MVIASGCNIFHSKILDSIVSVEVTDVFRSAQTRQMASLRASLYCALLHNHTEIKVKFLLLTKEAEN